MSRIVKHAWAACAALALLLSACGAPGTTATPTVDGNTQLTAIAVTVQAELTRAAELTPDPTDTPEPTATSEATPTPTEVLATATLAATATTAVQQPVVPDKAEYVGQSVADNSKFAPGTTFTMTWTLKNVGTTTWTTGYSARHYAGDALGAATTKTLPKEVKPGETVEVTLSMKAPATAGTFQSNWVLTNAQGVNFFPFYVIVEVTGTSAATATATQAAAAATATQAPPTATQPLPPSETPPTP